MAQYENYMPYAGTDTLEITNTLFRKVYQFMALGLIITSITAYLTAASPAMIRFFYGSRAPLIIAAVVEIGLVLYLGMAINKISAQTALILFLLYSFDMFNFITCLYSGINLSGVFHSGGDVRSYEHLRTIH